MRSSEDGKVIYPEQIVWVFNRNLITVMGYNDVVFTFSDGEQTYVDRRKSYGGKVECDASAYLQMFVSKDVLHKDVTVNVATSENNYALSFSLVWGAMNIGDEWQKNKRHLTWWRNFPQTFGMYVVGDAETSEDGKNYVAKDVAQGFNEWRLEELFPSATTRASLRLLEGKTANVFDYTFDVTFGTVKAHTTYFEIDDSECGCFVRWIDRQGVRQYQLFAIGGNTYNGENKDTLHGAEGMFYNIVRKNRSVSRRERCGVGMLDKDERERVFQILGSPVVDMWIGGEWVAVTVASSSLLENTEYLQDVEFEFELPNMMLQQL